MLKAASTAKTRHAVGRKGGQVDGRSTRFIAIGGGLCAGRWDGAASLGEAPTNLHAMFPKRLDSVSHESRNHDRMPDLRALLIERLQSRLPGRKAQARFAPDLGFGRHFAEPPADVRRAAVLTLLYRTQVPPIAPESALGRWRISLLVRPEHLEHHAGQIALPGGMIEEGESSGEAALRELHEELGVPRAGIEMLGELSPVYVFASDNFVVPWVAIASFQPTFILNVDEASAVVELPVAHLIEESHIGSEIREQNGVRFRAPFFRCGSHHIWGATAMILAELATILEAADAAASLDC